MGLNSVGPKSSFCLLVVATLVYVGIAADRRDAWETRGQPTQWKPANYWGRGGYACTSTLAEANEADALRYKVKRGQYAKNTQFLWAMKARRDAELERLNRKNTTESEEPDVCSVSPSEPTPVKRVPPPPPAAKRIP